MRCRCPAQHGRMARRRAPLTAAQERVHSKLALFLNCGENCRPFVCRVLGDSILVHPREIREHRALAGNCRYKYSPQARIPSRLRNRWMSPGSRATSPIPGRYRFPAPCRSRVDYRPPRLWTGRRPGAPFQSERHAPEHILHFNSGGRPASKSAKRKRKASQVKRLA
jgi:hypothetical protein